MKNNIWYTAKVTKGNQHGREIGFPTVNLAFDQNISLAEGVYATLVCFENKVYESALYFGPRLIKNETKPVLEIHIMKFNQDIYNQEIKYKVIRFIRGKIKFENMEGLKKQITLDIQEIKNILKDYEKRC